jgi:hypothetical protein
MLGTKAAALVKRLRNSKLVEHAAKDLLRAARLWLPPRDESHVDAGLWGIRKGNALASVVVISRRPGFWRRPRTQTYGACLRALDWKYALSRRIQMSSCNARNCAPHLEP